MESSLIYEPLQEEETEAAGSIVYGVMTNDRIQETITNFHTVGIRCAVVLILEGGELTQVVVREQQAIAKAFPFKEVKEAVANYDLDSNVCMVLVRDHRVCSVVGSRGHAQP